MSSGLWTAYQFNSRLDPLLLPLSFFLHTQTIQPAMPLTGTDSRIVVLNLGYI